MHLLKDIPLSAVLREKIIDLEARTGELETENTILKSDLRKANVEIQKYQAKNERLHDTHQFSI